MRFSASFKNIQNLYAFLLEGTPFLGTEYFEAKGRSMSYQSAVIMVLRKDRQVNCLVNAAPDELTNDHKMIR